MRAAEIELLARARFDGRIEWPESARWRATELR
jgi:hypothetical protein